MRTTAHAEKPTFRQDTGVFGMRSPAMIGRPCRNHRIGSSTHHDLLAARRCGCVESRRGDRGREPGRDRCGVQLGRAEGVLLVGFLSVALAYPRSATGSHHPSDVGGLVQGGAHRRLLAVLIVYAMVGVIAAWRPSGRCGAADRVAGSRCRARSAAAGRTFATQVRASERWHERFRVERQTRDKLQSATRRVSRRLQLEARGSARKSCARGSSCRGSPPCRSSPAARVAVAGLQRSAARLYRHRI